jgi:3-oxosteroid 1-dehydrogenase
MPEWDLATDFVSIGSGGGALVGALAAKTRGSDAIVVEKREVVGGNTAKSGGIIWIPNNPLMGPAGVRDSYEDAMSYFEDVVGEAGPASSFERRHAFLTQGPRMISFLQGEGVRFIRCEGYSDYYPDAKGASVRGRAIEGELFDGKRLGPWLDKIQRGMIPESIGLSMYTGEAARIAYYNRSFSCLQTAARAWARTKLAKARGQFPLTTGESYVGQMLFLALKYEIAVLTKSPLQDLVLEDGRVVGVVVEREGRNIRIQARQAVLIATGGFSHNTQMREKYLDPGAATDYSLSNPGETGEGIEIAISHGAATDLMEEAVWNPASIVDGHAAGGTERQRPGSIIVDAAGQRFCNEANSYLEVCKAQLERNHTTKAVPAFLIFDDDFRRRNAFQKGRPGVIPKELFDKGTFFKADTLEALAAQCGIDPAGLRAQVKRFNPNAKKGVDPEFHKGENAYNRYLGDPKWKPNNCLAPIEKPPFFATGIYPADVGTCGGILADEHARVLDISGDVIPGLYASGNATASVMGRKYLGAGASIANTSVFGYIAALHAT